MSDAEFVTEEGYTVDLDDEGYTYLLLEIFADPACRDNPDVVTAFAHINLTAWRVLLQLALRRLHGVLGESVPVDYLRTTAFADPLSLTAHSRALVRIDKVERLKFVSGVTAQAVDFDFLGVAGHGQVRVVEETRDPKKILEITEENQRNALLPL